MYPGVGYYNGPPLSALKAKKPKRHAGGSRQKTARHSAPVKRRKKG